MKRFIQRHADKVTGVLSGFDRLVFRGTLRRISFVSGLMAFLGWKHVLLKHFGAYAHAVSERVKAASCQAAREQGRPIQYLASSRTRKDAVARRIAERDGIREGLICILTCVEPCRTFEIYRNRDAKRLELVHRIRKCLHVYHYLKDPEFGFMHARLRPGTFDGEIVSDFKDRPEGVRIKHRLGGNAVKLKLYDKQGSVLRAKTTLQDASAFKVFRAKEGEPQGPKAWRPMRRGIADLHRRARVSQACNERYLDALDAADTSQPLGDLVQSVSRPVRWHGDQFRGLRPWALGDLALFRAVCRGEFSIQGFRNRDLLAHLFPTPACDEDESRRRSARISRQIRLLRAHGLIRKVPSSYRYQLSPRGREILATIIASQQVTLNQLNRAIA